MSPVQSVKGEDLAHENRSSLDGIVLPANISSSEISEEEACNGSNASPGFIRICWGRMGRLRTLVHEGMDLTYNQYKTLLTIAGRPECSLGDLARELEVAMSSASQMVDRLVGQGLVHRRTGCRQPPAGFAALDTAGGGPDGGTAAGQSARL